MNGLQAFSRGRSSSQNVHNNCSVKHLLPEIGFNLFQSLCLRDEESPERIKELLKVKYLVSIIARNNTFISLMYFHLNSNLSVGD